MVKNADRSATTRAKLIKTARECFAHNGYEDTNTQEILEKAGISRGAMYHHFKSKQELFEAVFIAVSDETIHRAARKISSNDSPLENLNTACLAWLHAAQRPEVATILLDQGPQVLGWKRARDLEAKTSLGLMMKGLQSAVESGELNVVSVELSARLLNAVLAEAALASLHNEPRASRAVQQSTIRQFIEGLRTRHTDR